MAHKTPNNSNALDIFLYTLKNLRDVSWAYRNAVSEFDHALVHMKSLERLKLFIEEPDTSDPRLLPEHRTYIAALAEYLYNKARRKPPSWVFKPEYTLPEMRLSLMIRDIIDTSNKELMSFYEAKSIPKVKRRNYIVQDVMSAY